MSEVYSDLQNDTILHSIGMRNDEDSPVSNTGVNYPSTIKPDFLTVVFSEDLMSIKKLENIGFYYVLHRFGRYKKRVLEGSITGYAAGHNGYKFSSRFYLRGSLVASAHFGGIYQKRTIAVTLTGDFCEKLLPDDWEFLYRFVKHYKGRITRFDIAADVYNGDTSVVSPMAVFERFKLDSKRFEPAYKLSGRSSSSHVFINGSDGDTLEIGSRDSFLRQVIYEKGRKEKSFEFPNWIRFEARWRSASKKYEIDLSLLLPENWFIAWSSSCAYYQEVLCPDVDLAKSFLIRYTEKPSDAFSAVVGCLRALRVQYGSFLSSIRQLFSDTEILEMLCSGKLPDDYNWNSDIVVMSKKSRTRISQLVIDF